MGGGGASVSTARVGCDASGLGRCDGRHRFTLRVPHHFLDGRVDETTPSRPSLQAWRNTVSPSPSVCSLKRCLARPWPRSSQGWPCGPPADQVGDRRRSVRSGRRRKGRYFRHSGGSERDRLKRPRCHHRQPLRRRIDMSRCDGLKLQNKSHTGQYDANPSRICRTTPRPMGHLRGSRDTDCCDSASRFRCRSGRPMDHIRNHCSTDDCNAVSS
jgi:hypothetical protein